MLATWRSQSCRMPEISEALRPMVAGARYFSTMACMVSTVSPPHQAPPGTTPSPNPVDPSDSLTCTSKIGCSLVVKAEFYRLASELAATEAQDRKSTRL